MNASIATFPGSLRTATPADGLTLARQLADRALQDRAQSTDDMAAHPTSAPAPSLESLTTTYFQAVAAANDGWRH